MVRSAIIAALVASPAFGADRCFLGSDPVSIAPHGNAAAEVTYYNVDPPASTSGTCTVDLDGLSVSVTLRTTYGSAEHVTITPPPEFLAIPPEAEVMDGDTLHVLIVRPAF
jgi:hypothetical protein